MRQGGTLAVQTGDPPGGGRDCFPGTADGAILGDRKMNRIRVSGSTLLAAFAPAICFVVVFALVAPRAAGQSTGSIVGQVTDLSGAVVPGAKIIVTGVE